MTRGFGEFRLAARLARREVFRRPGRTLLVALLVAVPVAGMVVADVMVRTEHQTPLQQWRNRQGQADAMVVPGTTGSGRNPVAAMLAKSRVVAAPFYVETRLFRTADGRRSSVRTAIMAMSDPITRGIMQMTSGRAPMRGNEVFLTRTAAQKLGVGVGDTLRLVRPARHSFVVTGVGERADEWGASEMAIPTGSAYPFEPRDEEGASIQLLVDLPASIRPADLEALLASPDSTGWGLQVSPALVPLRPDYFGSSDAEAKVRWSWVVGALVLTIAGIVIAAAFAIGARRQLVTLGQLAANGASPRMLRRALFLQGTWTGVVGALMGLALAAVALASLAPHLDRILGKNVQPFTVRMADLVPIVLLGVVAATIAALVPARVTSRLPVLAALAGRRPLGRVPKWLPITGACSSISGLALLGLAVLGSNGSNGGSQVWALTAIIGGVGVLLGACAIAPAYVSVLEPAASRARGSGRVAIRSLARQRTRTGAVVSSIAATGALAIAASSLLISVHEKDDRAARYVRDNEVHLSSHGTSDGSGPGAPSARLVSAVAKALPGATRLQISAPTRTNVSWSIESMAQDRLPDPESGFDPLEPISIGIADRALLTAYALNRHDREQLDERGALVLGEVSGSATIALVTHVAPNVVAPEPRRFTAAMVEGLRYPTGSLPRLIVTPDLADRLGMTSRPGAVVVRNPTTLSSDQRSLIAEAREDEWDAEPAETYTSADFYTPPSGIDPFLIESVLVGIALVLVLFVVAVNLALSAAETRDERDVLTVVGAAPTSMRRANGYKAALLTVMGTLLAIPVGFLPVAVFVLAADEANLPLVFPSRVVTLLVVALPIVAGLVTTAGSGISLRFRPVRISTMAYD